MTLEKGREPSEGVGWGGHSRKKSSPGKGNVRCIAPEAGCSWHGWGLADSAMLLLPLWQVAEEQARPGSHPSMLGNMLGAHFLRCSLGCETTHRPVHRCIASQFTEILPIHLLTWASLQQLKETLLSPHYPEGRALGEASKRFHPDTDHSHHGPPPNPCSKSSKWSGPGPGLGRALLIDRRATVR